MSATDSLAFLEGASPQLWHAMHALAAAESLTDDVARKVLKTCELPEDEVDALLNLLHCTSFVVPRNGEWQFTHKVRDALIRSSRAAGLDQSDVHELLLQIGETGEKEPPASGIPAYLLTHAGRAYHAGALGRIPEALRHYARAATGTDAGVLWLAGALAQEQQEAGILPETAIEPAYLRAYTCYRDGDDEAAYRGFKKVSRSGYHNELVALSIQFLGVIETHRGKLEAALRYLDDAVERFQDLGKQVRLILALRARAIALRKDEQFVDALDDVKHAVSLCHDGDLKASLLNVAAKLERLLGKDNDAMADLDEAARMASARELPAVLSQRAGLKRDFGDLRGALRDLERATWNCQGEELAVVLNTRASVLADLGNFVEALGDLDRAANLAGPEVMVAVLNTRSAIRRDTGDLVGALRDLETISATPAERKVAADQGVVDHRTQDLQKTIARLNAAGTKKEVQRFWFTHFRDSARKYNHSKVWARAGALFNRAIEYASTEDELFSCYFHVGMSYEKSAEPERGLSALHRAVEIRPDNSAALATLARIIDRMNSPIEECEPYFVRAVELDPRNAWAKTWFALALSRGERHEQAIAIAREAAHETANAILLYNLAVVLAASPKGADHEEALDVARRAEALAMPRFTAPRELIERLLARSSALDGSKED